MAVSVVSVAPRTMEDSAYPFPPGQQPPADCVLIYGPGDTPHTWTPGDINEQSARYRMPGFVRSNPQGASYVQDCNAFVAWLKAIGAPRGITVFLDLETAVAAGYVSAFGYIMNLEGYNVCPYGSIGYIWQNPPLDGLFVSHPDGSPHLCTPARCGNGLNTNARITQYQFDGSYDMSLIDPNVPLWDRQGGTSVQARCGASTQEMAMYSFCIHPNGVRKDTVWVNPAGAVEHAWSASGSLTKFDGTESLGGEAKAVCCSWDDAGNLTVVAHGTDDVPYVRVNNGTKWVTGWLRVNIPLHPPISGPPPSLKGQKATVTFD